MARAVGFQDLKDSNDFSFYTMLLYGDVKKLYLWSGLVAFGPEPLLKSPPPKQEQPAAHCVPNPNTHRRDESSS